jgi:transcriptional regulator with XRE-family HTH domain
MITSTGTTTLSAGEPLTKVPYSLAFGLALVVSCASYAPAPTYSWTVTPTGAPVHAADWPTTSSSPVSVSVAHKPQPVRTSSELIADLRLLSGLTTDQVGRLLGVSRRSVHNWLNGGVMARQHAERVSEILALVKALDGETPEQRRAALLDSSGGQSLFHKLLKQLKPNAQLQVSAASARERISL